MAETSSNESNLYETEKRRGILASKYYPNEFEMLPSGKIIKRQVDGSNIVSSENAVSKFTKKLRFSLKGSDTEDHMAIVEKRMQGLESNFQE